MLSPFEELEYLSDFLPEEGESVVVSRQAGELVCQPFQPESLREGISDPRLYGVLVQVNERLNAVGALPIWICVIGFFWTCTGLAMAGRLSWTQWFLVPGAALLLLPLCIAWIRFRQHRLFTRDVLPLLESVLHTHRTDPHAFLGAVRQHEEMRTLLDELIRWIAPPPIVRRPVHPEMRR
jgi:hypothetical protein